MKYFNYLKEEYLSNVDVYGKTPMDVYVNPDSGDFKDLRKQGIKFLRFIADPGSKQLFIFDSGRSLHSWVIKYLVNTHHIKNQKVICGFCNIEGNKLVGAGMAYLNDGDMDDFLSDTKWFKKYITNGFTEVGSGNLVFQ